ncbi:hypothetical protein JXJ21_02120 [candidate division KSB1 bacterium]|nr:hypothetical protein [candidate division KSB1 bacterium]
MKHLHLSIYRIVTVKFLLAMTALSQPVIAKTPNPEWINFTSGTGVNAICDAGEYVWVGGTGLTKLHKKTGAMVYYNKANSGLPHNHISTLNRDSDGTLWIGMNRGGLAKFDGDTWTVYTTENSGLPGDVVNAIAFDKQKSIWIGTSGGLAMLNGTNWIEYNRENYPLPDDDVRALAIDSSGALWVGCKIHWWHSDSLLLSGLVKFDGENWTTYEAQYPNRPDVFAVTIDADGSTWIGTGGAGLARLVGENWITYNTDNSDIPDNYVYDLALDPQGN